MKIFYLFSLMSLTFLLVACVEDETQEEQDYPTSDQEYPAPQKEVPPPGRN